MSVAIIGAGVAGLSCARTLKKVGVDAVIYEARDRVGGRLYYAQQENGGSLDMGAHRLHGGQKDKAGNDSMISVLLKEAGASFLSLDKPGQYFGRDGKPMSDSAKSAIIETLDDIYNQAFEQSNTDRANISPSANLHSFVHDKIQNTPSETKADVQAYEEFWRSWSGCPSDAQSLKYVAFWEETEEGQDLIVQSGYGQILPLLSAGLDVKLNAPVSKVCKNAKGVEVVLEDGIRVQHDAVVVTVPLGCLKRDMISFDPALPSSIRTAIDQIGYGTFAVLYVFFNQAFWAQSASYTYTFLPFTSNGQSHFPVNIRSHAHFDPPHNQPILRFDCPGNFAKHLSSLSLDDQVNAIMAYVERLPGYDATDKICRPMEIKLSGWHNDPLAGYGTWSNAPAGSDHLEQHSATLRKGGQGVFFAGEAIPIPNSNSAATVNGALMSGDYQAKQVAAWLNR